MKLKLITALLIAMSFAQIASAEKKTPLDIYVYVTAAPSPQSEEGFVDASNKILVDSEIDLKKQLDGKKFHPKKGYPGSQATYHVVADAAKADAILTIAARGTNLESFGSRTTAHFYENVVTVSTIPQVARIRWVSMVISVGNYRKEVVAYSTNQSQFSVGAWKDDSKVLALEAAGWVMANEPKILERRDQR